MCSRKQDGKMHHRRSFLLLLAAARELRCDVAVIDGGVGGAAEWDAGGDDGGNRLGVWAVDFAGGAAG